MTRLVLPKDRCTSAIEWADNKFCRCILKKAHAPAKGGMHQGKGPKRDPFRRISWFGGDAREFFTDKDNEFTWSERKK